MHGGRFFGSVRRMKSARRKAENSRSTGARGQLRVLRMIEANSELSQRQLATESGVSFGGINYALKALVKRGLVEIGNVTRSGTKVASL